MNKHEEKKWKVQCCRVKGQHTEDLHMTDQVRLCYVWVIPCQINTKNARPLQISTKLGLQVVPHDLLAHIKFWPQKLYGFCFTALPKLDFSCIFAIPDFTKQTITSFLQHQYTPFLYVSVAYKELSYVV